MAFAILRTDLFGDGKQGLISKNGVPLSTDDEERANEVSDDLNDLFGGIRSYAVVEYNEVEIREGDTEPEINSEYPPITETIEEI